LSPNADPPWPGARHPDHEAEAAHLGQTLEAIDQRIAELSVHRGTGKDWTRESARRMRTAEVRRLEAARAEPYFGRVDFTPDDRERTESYRIGRTAAPGVTDWRAPVASLFYSRGGVSYEAPEGTISGHVELRRHYRIHESRLLELFDVRIADEFLHSLGTADPPGPTQSDAYLIDRLGLSTGRHMRDIVATIQAEQDRVLRAPLYKAVVLQGVAGSGKTAVALHRVAYLLYTYAGRIQAARVLVLAPSRLLLGYVERLLPASLGVEGVIQKTVRQWEAEIVGLKGGGRFVPSRRGALTRFVRSAEAVAVLDGWAAQASKESKAAKETMETRRTAGRPDVIAGGPALRCWLQFLKSPRGACLHCRPSSQSSLAGWASEVQTGRYSPEDLAAMAFLAKRLSPYSRQVRYDHIVVDEAQDLCPVLCDVLSRSCRHPSLTLVGDLAQALGPYAACSWQEVLGAAFLPAQVAYHSFRTSYRCSRPIVEVARQILQKGEVDLDLPEAVPRDGPPPEFAPCRTDEELETSVQAIALRLAATRGSVAVIAPDRGRARQALGWVSAMGFAAAGSVPGEGAAPRWVAPLGAVRGLEFDAVILLDAGHRVYCEPGSGPRRLYTAVTRALHELCVVWSGPPSPYLPFRFAGNGAT